MAALGDLAEGLRFHQVAELSGLPLDVVWIIARKLADQGRIAFDVFEKGRVFSLTEGAAAARRQHRAELGREHRARIEARKAKAAKRGADTPKPPQTETRSA